MTRDPAKGRGQVLRRSSQLLAEERRGKHLWEAINISELVSKALFTLSFVVDTKWLTCPHSFSPYQWPLSIDQWLLILVGLYIPLTAVMDLFPEKNTSIEVGIPEPKVESPLGSELKH